MRGISFVARRSLALGSIAFACSGLAGCAEGGAGPGEEGKARVNAVIDGDTVEVERIGRVRLIGVDTPEKGRCGDDAATRFTREQLLDEVVEVELGEDPRDRYDRTLAYLSREGQSHNLALLREGYATVLTIPPNDKYVDLFERAERDAKPTASDSLASCERRGDRATPRQQLRPGGGSGDGDGGRPERADGRCLPSSACPGRRDGDGDGCYCE